MKNRRITEHQFSRVPEANISRSVFNRSHDIKTAFNEGLIVPIYVDEVLPGDTFNLSATLFGRLSTQVVPIMDNLYLDTFFFFVPLRLVWSDFEKFMGEKENPDDDFTYSVPQVTSPESTGFVAESLFDYMGLPIGVTGLSVSAFHSRAYNLIYNSWFRDQNLIDSVVVDKDAGPDDAADYVLLRRAKRHDYFTSCLPFPQKGEAIQLPLTGDAPVLGIGAYNVTNMFTNTPQAVLESNGDTRTYSHAANIEGPANTTHYFQVEGDSANGEPLIRADLSDITAATINELRLAFQLQRLEEKWARGGSRYTEIIRSCFGVISPDSRLQRPEYLGGSVSPVYVTPVPQTSVTTSTTPQANLASYATVTERGTGFSKSFTEHGVVLGLACLRADITYQQGIRRMWSRTTKEDFYWPSLANIGEQPVYAREIYAQGTSDDSIVFGYQERYAEYRYFPSQITGKLRSTYSTPLDMWHLAEEFSSRPTLSQEFIEENAPMSRILAVDTEPHMILDGHIKINCARPMPVYSVPGLIDHF